MNNCVFVRFGLLVLLFHCTLPTQLHLLLVLFDNNILVSGTIFSTISLKVTSEPTMHCVVEYLHWSELTSPGWGRSCWGFHTCLSDWWCGGAGVSGGDWVPESPDPSSSASCSRVWLPQCVLCLAGYNAWQQRSDPWRKRQLGSSLYTSTPLLSIEIEYFSAVFLLLL